ncbi:MAG: OmpH family outer membrane protein [Acidobacteriota bacterium]|nr:OmpH family outer membrane protein [Acidobacteriota bacterium]
MKTVLKFAPVLMMVAAVTASAQTKIATINMQQALAETSDGKKAIADLRAKFGPRDQDMQKRSQDLQLKQEQYRKTQATLSDDQKSKLENDIAVMQRSLQRDQDDAQQDMQTDEQKMVQELGGKIMAVVNKYATDNKYTMVFDVSGQPNNIMFASSAVDITRDIIALYDKAAPQTPPTAPSAAKAATPAKP